MGKFYCFNNLTHIKQPTRSSWCWASSLEKMIKGFKSNSTIGVEDYEIVSHYNSYLNVNSSKLDCRIESSECHCDNLELKDDHLVKIFNEAGFKAEEIDKAIINNYDKIVETLNTNQSPIILKTIDNNAHMELIIGYGELDNFKYLLISDPNNLSDTNYICIKEYISTTKIDKVWTTKVKGYDNNLNQKNIEKDFLLYKNIKYLNEFITKNELQLDKLELNNLKNPWNYLKIKDTSLINKINNKDDVLSFLSHQLYKEERTSQFNCPDINRCLRNISVIGKPNIAHDRYGCNYLKKNQCIFREYGTIVKTKKVNGNLLVKPISYPANYKISNNWVNYHIFKENLENNNPKLSSFKLQ
ncbi:papain-like cysteine protease family protein [Tenacibaculum jejuense]|uniref:Uncharacterized protein n=1 Tax=Tenacibaculum jejuense TaxID=584609 RepID=A0A238U954_9FLAO|nr:papain-like cysteine protease family protein [Tenacibaculum jejuense]SNR15632.1 protein of unknown function [Tenacibaculum jejuense]